LLLGEVSEVVLKGGVSETKVYLNWKPF
jgi:hypothetical protein